MEPGQRTHRAHLNHDGGLFRFSSSSSPRLLPDYRGLTGLSGRQDNDLFAADLSFPAVLFALAQENTMRMAITMLVSLLWGGLMEQVHSEEKIPVRPTHEQVGTIDLPRKGNIQTFCLDHQGRLLIAVAHPAATNKEDSPHRGSILIYSTAGKPLDRWDLPFKPTAVNVAPSGQVFVAGEGRIAKLDANGRILKQSTTPQIKDMETFQKQVRQHVIKTYQQQAKLYEKQLQQLKELITNLEQIPAEKRSAAETLQLRNAKRQWELNQKMHEKVLNNGSNDSVINQYVQMKLKVPGLAVSGQDVFVAVAALKGYGYDIYRMDHNFYNPRPIVSGLRGCCGQMDIQTSKGELYVAENSRHRVCRFDRDGKSLATWGQKSRSGQDGFSGCCNPMNLRFGMDGEVLTAESGIGAIKRFSPDGEYLGLLGHAELRGGCKHVAIAMTSDRKTLFMLDITRSRIAVLKEKTSTADTEPSSSNP